MIDHVPRCDADPVLAAVATRYTVRELAAHVLGVRAHAAQAQQEDDRLRAVVNASALAEIAATARPPADVARLAAELLGRGEPDLAAHVLDVAAVSRKPCELARLAAALDCPARDVPAADGPAAGSPAARGPAVESPVVDSLAAGGTIADSPAADSRTVSGTIVDSTGPRGEGQAAQLLRAVIRRRLPPDAAAVLCELADAGEGELAREFLAGLVAARSAPDAVLLVLALRVRGRGELADQAARAMAAGLCPAGLAAFSLGLRAVQDGASAARAVEAALEREAAHVADLIGHLFASDEAYADLVLNQAVDRSEPVDKLVLASLLDERLAPATASAVWARVVPGLEDNKIVEAFDALAQYAGPSGVHRALREAARAHSIDRVSALVLQVKAKRMEGGVDTIFQTVVRHRPVPEIDQLASQLRDAAWTDLAWALLDLAIEHVHERDDIGDAAALIRLLLARIEEMERRGKPGRGDTRRWRQEIPGIIRRIAQRRDPGHLMGLVNGLVRCGGYEEYRDAVEEAVLAEYQAADLAVLPQVRGYEHLPVVLELMCRPLSNPLRLPPAEVPVVIAALRTAGAADDYLDALMAYTGNRRDLDFRDIAIALRRAGLEQEAEAVVVGHARRMRGRRMKAPRFFGR